MTELKMLAAAQGQRLVMLTFAPSPVEPDLVCAVEQLPFDLLILDRKLNVTYANAGAVRSSGAAGGAILGLSALTLAPTNALPREVYVRALEGCHYHDDAVELSAPAAPLRYFEMDVQPLEGLVRHRGLGRPVDRSRRKPLAQEACKVPASIACAR